MEQDRDDFLADACDAAERAYEPTRDVEKVREAVRLAVRRCATLWTGKKPIVDVMLVEVSAMKWTSVLAIYFLIFCFTAFVTLPFGVRTAEEAGADRVPGQADSAPHRFDLPRHLLRAAVIAALLTALFAANYQFGWITVDDLDLYN